MKKIFSILTYVLLVCFVVTAFAACTPDGIETDELVVYNWADYIYDYEQDFKDYYKERTGKNIQITYVTFDTNETMLTRLKKGDSNVDVVCPSEYAIQQLIENDMLMPMYYFNEEMYTESFGNTVSGYVHNADNIEDGVIQKVKETFGDIEIKKTGERVSMVDYFVPYMYGTLGILYNKYAFMEMGIYDEEIMNKANWGIFFNDDGDGNILHEGLTGNILMKDSIRDSYAATIFYILERGMLNDLPNADKYANMSAGELINAVDDDLLEIVRDVLIEQKDQLFGYEVDFGKDDLLMGNAIVDLAWSGDAMYAVEESWNDDLGEDGDYELAYYVPHSAGNLWLDGWVVPKSHNPNHLNAIKLFINFLNTPSAAAQNFMEIGYTPAIKPEALLNDESGEVRSVLSSGYYVYDPEYWDLIDEDGNVLTVDDCDYESWEEFVDYFFYYVDEIDGSNWRYPFVSAELNADNNRNINSLGVMRDFGDKNKDVVTAWNYARSSGVTALPLLGWTALVVAVALGALWLVIWLKHLKNQKVKLTDNSQN